jgi:hypothetical protein
MTAAVAQRLTLIGGLVLTAILASCQYPPTSYGEAVGHNMAAHIINPEPAPPELGAPAFNSTRAALAAERYLADEVKEPETLEITDVIIGGTGTSE